MQQPLTAEIVTAAIAGFEQQKKHIEAQITKLRSVLHGGTPAATSEANKPRRTQSTAARKIAPRARRAKIHSLSAPLAAARVENSMPKRRRISEEGMKRIIAATKKRWALKRIEAAKAAKKIALVKKKRPIQKAA